MAALGIDIPIGLLYGPRACDLTARKLLGVRGCCIFPAPSRAAVYGEHYRQSSELNQERDTQTPFEAILGHRSNDSGDR
jgi:predicted RNase H-like nuclease